MRKSFTPYYEFENSNLKANISDEELMSNTEKYKDADFKASEKCIKNILDFAASFEIQKTNQNRFKIFKN